MLTHYFHLIQLKTRQRYLLHVLPEPVMSAEPEGRAKGAAVGFVYNRLKLSICQHRTPLETGTLDKWHCVKVQLFFIYVVYVVIPSLNSVQLVSPNLLVQGFYYSRCYSDFTLCLFPGSIASRLR